MDALLDLDSAFDEASMTVKQFLNVDKPTMLRLYGLYKQANQGECNISKPGILSYTARQKWEAWNALRTTSVADAKSQYIELVNSLAPNDEQGAQSAQKASTFGVSVSCMAKTEQELNDSDKTIFDWLKEGNLENVSSLLTKDPSLLSHCDESRMALIHWAADRGDIAIIQLLAKNDVDVNMTDGDGQTPLHYAFACGHDECIRLLETLGANPNIRDNNGLLPSDLADS